MLHIWRGMAKEDGARKGDREREKAGRVREFISRRCFFLTALKSEDSHKARSNRQNTPAPLLLLGCFWSSNHSSADWDSSRVS